MTLNFATPFTSLEQTASGVEDGKVFGGQGFHYIAVQVDGIVATDIVQIEAKNHDDLTFVQVGDDITADGVYAVEPGARYYRAAVTTAAGGGTITAVFTGSD